MSPFTFGLLVFVLLVIVLALFIRKAGLQLQYLRLKKNKKPGKISDFLKFSWSNQKERQLRVDAFLLFPMLYAINLDEKKEELNQIKREVKQTHILIYVMVAILMILGIISKNIV